MRRRLAKFIRRYWRARLLGVADVAELAVVEQHRPVAVALHRGHVVGDEHDRPAAAPHLAEDVRALLLEGRVADGQHLVDQQDVGVRLDHHREGEPHQHPRRVVLQLQVDELLELGEVEHGVEPRRGLAPGEAHHHPVERHVLAGGQLGVEADAELDERARRGPAIRIGPASAR